MFRIKVCLPRQIDITLVLIVIRVPLPTRASSERLLAVLSKHQLVSSGEQQYDHSRAVASWSECTTKKYYVYSILLSQHFGIIAMSYLIVVERAYVIEGQIAEREGSMPFLLNSRPTLGQQRSGSPKVLIKVAFKRKEIVLYQISRRMSFEAEEDSFAPSNARSTRSREETCHLFLA